MMVSRERAIPRPIMTVAGTKTLSYRGAVASAIQTFKAAGHEQPWEERHDRTRRQSRQLVFAA